VVAQLARNRYKSYLGEWFWEPCILDTLGSLAQPRGLPYQGSLGSGRGRAPWRRSCDWGNCSGNIVPCEPAMHPLCQLQRPLCSGIGHIPDRWGVRHLTEVLDQDYLVGGNHPLFSARDHPLLVPHQCHCLGTCCSLPSGRIHAWHGLVRKAGPPGHIASSDNFLCTNVSTHHCFAGIMAPKVDTISFINS
jgi:hypothetical protein